ncbi:MAG: hypothetical protein APR54_00425 [Candidatus Cloacimonas sp. SDB]|nr:MAG: hypothetical protein APR54_00425 [Candidatus Cloacimonas sp. SDB]
MNKRTGIFIIFSTLICLLFSLLHSELVINLLNPTPGNIQLFETAEQLFLFSGYDDDGDTLYYNWELDSVSVATDSTYNFTTDYASAGIYALSLAVRDSLISSADTTFNWTIEVLDVDQPIVVDSLFPAPGILEITETDSIQFYFSGYDPDGNTLSYEWLIDTTLVATDSVYTFLTDYTSAGTYDLIFNVSDNFSRNDTTFSWQINVADVDQPIVVDTLYPAPDSLTLQEFDQIEFVFSGYDPDGNELIFTWELDSVLVSSDSIYTFSTDHTSEGIYDLALFVNDGFASRDSAAFFWQLTVQNLTTLLVPEHFTEIQSALEAAVSGDTILVSPGIYSENINFSGKNIYLSSLYYLYRDSTLIDSTIIDGSGLGPVVTFNSGEDSTAVLNGFTLQNGLAANGGGIYCEATSPVLSNLKVKENEASSRGGGIYCLNSEAIITACEIMNNSAFIGAGAEFYNSDCQIINSTISENVAAIIGGGLESYNSRVAVYNTVISGNSSSDLDGGGIAGYNNSELTVVHSVIAQNSASYGGGIALHNTDFVLLNSIVSNNTNYGLYFENGSLAVSYSSFWQNSLADFYNCGPDIGKNVTVNANNDSCDVFYNIQLDPNFSDPFNADFSLQDISLCIGAGDTLSFPLFDIINQARPAPWNSKPDLGAYENGLGIPVDSVPIIAEYFPLADTLVINETDSLNFYASAYDPNGREVFYSWQLDSLQVATDSAYTFYTDYFSAGRHRLDLTVTDSTDFTRADTTHTWIIDVIDVDQEIVINYLEPAAGDTTIVESDNITFEFSGYDPDLNDLIYLWEIDSIEAGSDSAYTFNTDFTSSGVYVLELTVSDGFDSRNTLNYRWDITVENVTTFHVPELVSTIQGAINVAVDGDTVLVHAGHYYEILNFLGKKITVGSLFFTTNDTSYIAQTTIDGSNQTNRSLVTFNNQEDSASVLTGFRLINGSGFNGTGGGIRCEAESSPRLQHLLITENSSYTGGGIYCSNSSNPEFINCIIRGNLAFEGGGLYANQNSSPVFINCLFHNNSGLSQGGAVKVSNAAPEFIHNTISANDCLEGAAFYLSGNAQPEVMNSIIWNNTAAEIVTADTLSGLNITYSIISPGWSGEGNMEIDPLFIDPANGNFICSDYSYAIGSGTPAAGITFDFNNAGRPFPSGSSPDLGIYEHVRAVPIDGPIIINEVSPSPGNVTLNETDSLEFYVTGYDFNGAALEYSWMLDTDEVSIDSNFVFKTDLESAGDYFLMVTITDNYDFRQGERSQIAFTWSITVNDVTPPEVPENIVITTIGDTVQICWEPVTDAVAYIVYSADTPEGDYTEDLSGTFNDTCWSSLIEDTRKFFKVTAIK